MRQIIDDFRKKQGSGLKNENKQAKAPTPPTADEHSGSSAVEADTGEGATSESQKKGSQGIKRDWKTLSLKDLSVGGDGGATAATDDKLDGVSDNERTILSTREFKFFAYYQRIKELLRQFWKPNVERKLAKLYQTGHNISAEELVTKILVLLDEKGGIKKISRVSGSGFEDVDDAAIEAFRKAAPFPNPPKGIIDADGFVRIRWDFILTVEAAPRIQFQTVGNTHLLIRAICSATGTRSINPSAPFGTEEARDPSQVAPFDERTGVENPDTRFLLIPIRKVNQPPLHPKAAGEAKTPSPPAELCHADRSPDRN